MTAAAKDGSLVTSTVDGRRAGNATRSGNGITVLIMSTDFPAKGRRAMAMTKSASSTGLMVN